MKLAKQIRMYRKASGLTQEVLAEKLNTTRQSVSNWEQDTLEPNNQVLNQLTKIIWGKSWLVSKQRKWQWGNKSWSFFICVDEFFGFYFSKMVVDYWRKIITNIQLIYKSS